jgi:antitoxin (DNA-binding transcriptional repressor) of toxin-antitoxin stability system
MQIKTVDVQDAQASWDALLALIREGVEIILTEGGTPLARLTPVEANQRIADLHPGGWMSDDFDEPLPA